MADMWTAKKITADAADKFQVEAGLLLNKFDVKTPKEPDDADIVCETTGDFSIKCVPQTQNMFDGVNNADPNAMEGLQITSYEAGLSVNALSVTTDTIKLALGACEVGEDGGISPRKKYHTEDFKELYWIGDMVAANQLLCIVLHNTISKGGFVFTATNNGKGTIALDLSPMPSTKTPDKPPIEIYILTKQSGAPMKVNEQTAAEGKTAAAEGEAV